MAQNNNDNADDTTKMSNYDKGCEVSNLIFHGTDIICGLLIVIDSILILLDTNTFYSFFVPLYTTVFGFLIILFVIYVPSRLYASLYFYFNFCGRGLTFLFVGSVMMTFGDDFSLATGSLTIIMAFVYGIMSIGSKFCKFPCSLPPPIAQYNEGFPSKNNTNDNNNNNDKQLNEKDNSTDREQVPMTIVNDNQQTDVYGDANTTNDKYIPDDKAPDASDNTYDNNKQVYGSPDDAYDNDKQVYGSADDADAYDNNKAEYAPIAVNNNGPSLLNNSRSSLNNQIMNSFGKDFHEMDMEQVTGYNAAIPKVLILLQKQLNDTGGYQKNNIFDPPMIEHSKDKDSSYLISHNIISFFSSLPSPLLSFIPAKVLSMGVSKDAMWKPIHEMPDQQASITEYLWDILAKVAKNESYTHMNSERLARIFGPLCTMLTEKDIKGQYISTNALQASKNIVFFRRGIDWRMGDKFKDKL